MPPRRETESYEGAERSHEEMFNFILITLKKKYIFLWLCIIYKILLFWDFLIGEAETVKIKVKNH